MYSDADEAVRKRKMVAPGTIPGEDSDRLRDQVAQPDVPQTDALKTPTQPRSYAGGYNEQSGANAGANGRVTSPQALMPRVAEAAPVATQARALSSPGAALPGVTQMPVAFKPEQIAAYTKMTQTHIDPVSGRSMTPDQVAYIQRLLDANPAGSPYASVPVPGAPTQKQYDDSSRTIDQNSQGEMNLVKRELAQMRNQMREKSESGLAARGVNVTGGVGGRYYRDIDKNVAEQLASRQAQIEIERSRQQLAADQQLRDEGLRAQQVENQRLMDQQRIDQAQRENDPLRRFGNALLTGAAGAVNPALGGLASAYIGKTGRFAPPATLPNTQLGGLDSYYDEDKLLRAKLGLGGLDGFGIGGAF